MDIAEIRKKAKSRKSSAAASTPPESPDQAPLACDQAAGAEVQPALPSDLPASEGQIQRAGLSALDRLFRSQGTPGAGVDEESRMLAEDPNGETSTTLGQYLAFQLGPEEYALDIARISEIIKLREFTDIPRVPDFILGLISLRGVVVPVFDLRRRFRLGETGYTPAARIIVCRDGDTVAGLLVDSINQVIHLEADRIEPPPAVLSGIDRDLVDGVGRYQGRMIILLDLASVLDVDKA